MPELKPGDPAPRFKVKDHEGKEHTLEEAKGKSLILWFFPRADTPGWTAEGRGFRDHKQEYDRKNALIFGVSFDTPAANKKFAEKHGFTFPLLCDTEHTMGLAYGAADDASASSARRVGVLIDPDGKVKHWFPKVDARAFPEEALKLL